MQKAGGIIALIAGIFGVIAALFTLTVGGIGGVFHKTDAQTITSYGYLGIFFSFMIIILGAVSIGTKSRVTGIFLVISSILGAVTGGTAVAIFMALSLIGGILSIMGVKETNTGDTMKNIFTRPIPTKVLGYIILGIILVFFIQNIVSSFTPTPQKTETPATIPEDSTWNDTIIYGTPFGLTWGQNFKLVHKELSRRFRFNRSGEGDYGVSFFAEYRGDYLDFANSIIEAAFFHDSLVGITIQVPKQGRFTISRTWQQIVNLIINKYGLPDSISLPPENSLIPDSTGKKASVNKRVKYINSTNNYNLWENHILEGSWTPFSIWRFKDVTLICMVALSPPDRKDTSVLIIITERERFKQWYSEIKKKESTQPKDL